MVCKLKFIPKEGLALLGYVSSIQVDNKRYGAEAKPPPPS